MTVKWPQAVKLTCSLCALALVVDFVSAASCVPGSRVGFRELLKNLLNKQSSQEKAVLSQPCPGSIATGMSISHTAEVEALIKDINAGDFKDLPGETAGEMRSYQYDCTLGKGTTMAVVLRVKYGSPEKTTALKVAFGKAEACNLKQEAKIMSQAHADFNDFVPKPGPSGFSQSKKYFYLEMPEVGLTLDALLMKPNNGMTPDSWKKYFGMVVDMIIAMHKDIKKCFVMADLHFGNVALHKGNAEKLYLIDWGKALRCTKPKMEMKEENADPAAMSDAIKEDVLLWSDTIARCACTVTNRKCPYGKGKFNAQAYAKTAAAQFDKLEDDYFGGPYTWAKMKELEGKLKNAVKEA